jgi:hypothetical protein
MSKVTPIVGYALLAVLCCRGTAAVAQSEPLDVSSVLADLGSRDFTVREQATVSLLTTSVISEDTWSEWFAMATTPEQRHRLLIAARHHVLAQLRRKDFPERGPGSLGMSQRIITPNERKHLGRAGVIVNATFPGFPAYSHLRAGDLIVSINGTEIDDTISHERFIQMVQLNSAGQPITLVVLRDGAEVSFQITLASFEALSRMYERADQGVAARYEVQWRQARDRMLSRSEGTKPMKIELQP